MKNLEKTLNYPSKHVIGIGLGGDEAKGPARDFKAVFEKARRFGLHCVAHAGEVVGPESIWDAIDELGVERIGHGISAIQDKALIKYMKKKGIAFEVCPTSNVLLKSTFRRLKIT
jgi:adenosine deaminase